MKKQNKKPPKKETNKKTGKFVFWKETYEYVQTAKQGGNQTTSLVFTTGKVKIALSRVFFARILSETLIYKVLCPGEIKMNFYVQITLSHRAGYSNL